MKKGNTITENDRCAFIFLAFLISMWMMVFTVMYVTNSVLPEVAAIGTLIMAKYYEFVLEIKKEGL
ncbi:hypothetical protein LCGC14_1640330 [marine sediment metagenome]|uniref:Uncharacterized protein n=1 Tax=marine sediment metagenome TaxID=412755 RepID=A0A0F9IMA3_9ZZZZ